MLRSIALFLLLFTTPALAQTVSSFYNALSATPAVIAACPALVGATIGVQGNRATWLGQFASAPSQGCLDAVTAVANGLTVPPTDVQITSTLYPALNGTYPIDAASIQNLQFLTSYVSINNAFPAGQSSQIWLDVSSQRHVFLTTGEWLSFAKAMADFYTAVNLGQTPSQPVSIP